MGTSRTQKIGTSRRGDVHRSPEVQVDLRQELLCDKRFHEHAQGLGSTGFCVLLGKPAWAAVPLSCAQQATRTINKLHATDPSMGLGREERERGVGGGWLSDGGCRWEDQVGRIVLSVVAVVARLFAREEVQQQRSSHTVCV